MKHVILREMDLLCPHSRECTRNAIGQTLSARRDFRFTRPTRDFGCADQQPVDTSGSPSLTDNPMRPTVKPK